MNTPNTFDAVGLDAGSAWTRCVICRLEDDRMRFLGVRKAPSQGWLKGLIADQNAVSECMLAALREAEQHARRSPWKAPWWEWARRSAAPTAAACAIWAALRAVEQRDVNRAVERARRVRLPEGAMILQISPQDFVVDGHPGHRDPRKMMAGQIEANVHLVMSSQREHECLVAAVNQAHLAVEETVFEALAACYAAVLPEDRREGAAVLNIGAQSSELVVYHGDALQLAASLPISGDHFTRDVARGLCISFEDAADHQARIRLCPAECHGRELFRRTAVARRSRSVQRRTLNRILEARALELFQMVRAGAGARGHGWRPDGRHVPVRRRRPPGRHVRNRRGSAANAGRAIALPVGIQDWPDEICDPAWTTAAGLAMYSAKLKSQHEMQRQSYGLLRKVLK